MRQGGALKPNPHHAPRNSYVLMAKRIVGTIDGLSNGSLDVDHFGPRVFRPKVWVARSPKRFRPPSHVGKYNSETATSH